MGKGAAGATGEVMHSCEAFPMRKGSGSRTVTLAPGSPARTTKLSFPAQIRRCQVLTLAAGVNKKFTIHRLTPASVERDSGTDPPHRRLCIAVRRPSMR
jgi:hypothetical protein